MNLKKLYYPGGLKPLYHSEKCDRRNSWCICSVKKRTAKNLDIATLISKGPWRGSTVEVDAEGNNVLRHPNGNAWMRLYPQS